MSHTELQRFASAALNDTALAGRYAAVRSPADLAGLMRADGYDVTDDEVAAAFHKDPDLSDDQLDAVAGGWVYQQIFSVTQWAARYGRQT